MTQAPVFILVQPQMGENIGSVARVMGNFGLTDLRLVAPRDGWPNPVAETMSAGSPLIQTTQVFETVEAAIADLSAVYATTARPRDMIKPVLSGRDAMIEARSHLEGGARVGVLFGGERAGLPNEAITLSKAIITLPVDPGFASLNLAMAAGILAHEWRASDALPETFEANLEAATQSDLTGFYEHLETELDKAGFFYPPEKTQLMIQNLRNIFARDDLTAQEVRTLRGVVKVLSRGRGNARVERED